MTEKDMEKPSKMVAKTSFDRVKNQFLMVIIGKKTINIFNDLLIENCLYI